MFSCQHIYIIDSSSCRRDLTTTATECYAACYLYLILWTVNLIYDCWKRLWWNGRSNSFLIDSLVWVPTSTPGLYNSQNIAPTKIQRRLLLSVAFMHSVSVNGPSSTHWSCVSFRAVECRLIHSVPVTESTALFLWFFSIWSVVLYTPS